MKRSACPFLPRLLEEMRRKLRQRFRRKMGRYRVILQLRAEFVSDLFVNGVNNLLTCQHRNLSIDVILVLAHERATFNKANDATGHTRLLRNRGRRV